MENNEEKDEKVTKNVDVEFPLSGGETDEDLEESLKSITGDADDDEERKKDDNDPGLIFGGDNQDAEE